LSLKGKLTTDGKGTVTSTLVEKAKDATDFVDYADLSKSNGIIAVYGRDETLGRIPGTRVDQNKYPFAGLQQIGKVDYASSSNVAGCVKCHTDPYLKHGYIYGEVNNGSEDRLPDLQGLPSGQRRGRALRVAAPGRQS